MKDKISLYQLFILMVLLPYGTAILFYLVPETKQDVWVAMLFYVLGGIILQLIYTILYYKYPEDTLVTYMPKIYGKYIGTILSVIYISYFAYIGARNIRDFLELIRIIELRFTPMIYTGVLFVLVVIYSVNKGLKSIAGAAQFFFKIIIFVPILMWFLLLLMGDVLDFSNLKPVLQDGIFEVIKKGWPLIAFPYGETILFTMVYSSVLDSGKIRRIAILSIIFEGIILTASNILFIVTLGIPEASRSFCPLFHVVQRIDLREFLTRLDIIFVLVLIIGGFFKVTLFMYVSVYGTLQLTKIKSKRIVTYAIGLIMLLLAFIMAENYLEHLDIGLDFVVKYIHVPLQIIVPIITLCVYYMKQLIQSEKSH